MDIKINNRILGQKVNAYRKQVNLTVEELAEILEVSPSLIGLIERGSRSVTLKNAIKLSLLFKISVDDLIFGSSEVIKSSSTDELNDLINILIVRFNHKEKVFIVDFLRMLRRFFQ